LKRFALLCAFLAAPYCAGTQAATLAGDTIDAAMLRTVNTGYGLGRISGYGLEAPFTVVDGPSDRQKYSSAFQLDVDGNRFDLRFLTTAGWQPGIVLRLSDLDFSGPGTGGLSDIDVDTNLVGYSLTHGDDWIELAMGGTQFTPATHFTGTFNVQAVPEPGQLALTGLGLVAVAAIARRSRRSPAAQASA